MKSILIKDTTKEEREEIIKNSLDCGGGCENCSSCWLGGGSPGIYIGNILMARKRYVRLTWNIWRSIARIGRFIEVKNGKSTRYWNIYNRREKNIHKRAVSMHF